MGKVIYPWPGRLTRRAGQGTGQQLWVPRKGAHPWAGAQCLPPACCFGLLQCLPEGLCDACAVTATLANT